jgi:hypothetical protein
MSESPYWFPAKRYGWGWGPPSTWQGWLVTIVWCAMTVAGALWLAARHHAAFLLFMVAMTLVLLTICYAKGEPPRWRWAGRDV